MLAPVLFNVLCVPGLGPAAACGRRALQRSRSASRRLAVTSLPLCLTLGTLATIARMLAHSYRCDPVCTTSFVLAPKLSRSALNGRLTCLAWYDPFPDPRLWDKRVVQDGSW